MKILVTGGAGYIGSHVCMELNLEGMDVVVIDNLSNSHIDNLKEVEKYTQKKILFYKGDIRNRNLLECIFEDHNINAVVHLAAKKSITESLIIPTEYYDNNISGLLTLLEIMESHGCQNMYFSSSASVYGVQAKNPITEEFIPGKCSNAYARGKLMAEEILNDAYQSDQTWNITVFRYFNPIGAHSSGVIGEEFNDNSTNIMPHIIQVASRQKEKLDIFGIDYPTKDGTGVRDYIHVEDLACAHVHALKKFNGTSGFRLFNLGTGQGHSVLELIHTFEKVTEQKVPYVIKERRSGDISCCYCNTDKALEELEWKAKYSLEDMCKTAWSWHTRQLKKDE
ncbi:MAG: UDP-glucose 4-epimerase GalE [Anaerovoracaceae bacterium]